MKVAHPDSENTVTTRELMAKAKELETVKNFRDAEKIYLKLTKSKFVADKAFSRLMILYRKQKLYHKELDIINTAIDKINKTVTPTNQNARLKSLSLLFGKSVGLLDKKGMTTVDQQPVAGWKTRKLMVTKLIKKQSR